MESRYLSTGKQDQKLVNLVQSIADYMGVDCRVETRMMISSEDKHLIEVIDRLMGAQTVGSYEVEAPVEKSEPPVSSTATPAAAPSAAPSAPSASEVTARICKVCGQPFEPTGKRQVVCTNSACKKSRQAEFQRRWSVKKKELQAGSEEVSSSYSPFVQR